MFTNRKRPAFTLIELMVVIAIIGILAGVGAPTLIRYIDRGYVAEAISVIDEYKTAIGVHWSTNGGLPSGENSIKAGPIDLKAGVIATDKDYLPETIESILYQVITENEKALLSIVLTEDSFPNVNKNNRTIHLAIKGVGSRIQFRCGNYTQDVSEGGCCGFVDQTILPNGCNYNGVLNWLNK